MEEHDDFAASIGMGGWTCLLNLFFCRVAEAGMVFMIGGMKWTFR